MNSIDRLRSLARLWSYVRFLLRTGYRSVYSEDEFFAGLDRLHSRAEASVSLDLGCGAVPRNPFGAGRVQGIDLIAAAGGSEVIACNLFLEPIPWADGSVAFATAYDFIEHVPRVLAGNGGTILPFVTLMNEVDRVLEPGGLFFAKTPAYPHKQAFQDPTHVNIISEDTFPLYFCVGRNGRLPLARTYGFRGCFELVEQCWCGAKLLTLMRKSVSPAAPAAMPPSLDGSGAGP